MTASPRANDADRCEPRDSASAGDADRGDTPVDHLARAKSADRADPLASFRDRFVIDEAEVVYWGRCPDCVERTAKGTA